ncbi:Ig-like domain-containing protein [Candidatus Mycolicibacterium alkanivorans]|uniref:VCBS domain-containing protein n=1 Tax=Candidatus Mycolicibacterium alkanivorans TaxID=2954114 RepID=A0ABS9YTN1_9MYCO|nr:Ig-like domain-containing protein [Candidatus Mycolicibacterium alkanivorans]MCI4674507.1 VCBS domain-containing protein [Candidatus Mycolicibacterium alkanivorans]
MQNRRASSAPVTQSAIADAVLSAIGNPQPSPASTAGDSTAPAAVDTIATTTPNVVRAAAPAAPDTLGALKVPAANDLASSINDIFSAVVNSIQSLVEGVGLLVRRTFFNQAPTVNPIQTTGQTGGAITGSINAVDLEGDAVTYAVTQSPQHGSVTVDTSGNYSYTPNQSFTGADAFTVAAADVGFHINLFDLGRAASTDALVSVTQNTGPLRIGFNFIFGAGSQYWSSTARAELQSTAIYLSSYLIVTDPVTITYSVTGQNTLFGGTLASAGSDLVSSDPGFYDTVVQQKILTGVDANGSAPDGTIDWNFGQPWGFGNSVSATQYDFQSTAMHELLHTFGFLSVIDSAGNNTVPNWTTFDKFVVTSNGTHPINGSYVWLVAYNTNLTGGNGGLYFGGPNAEAAYGGNPVPLFTPSPWDSGSSMSHLDDATFTGANAKLMNARADTGLGIRTLSPVEIGILRDLGYTIADQPQALAIFIIGFAFMRRRRRSAECSAS